MCGVRFILCSISQTGRHIFVWFEENMHIYCVRWISPYLFVSRMRDWSDIHEFILSRIKPEKVMET